MHDHPPTSDYPAVPGQPERDEPSHDRPFSFEDSEFGDDPSSESSTGRIATDAGANRPPVADLIGFIDGTIDPDRRRTVEQYLAKNREARRRLRQLARLRAVFPDNGGLTALLKGASGRIAARADLAAGEDPSEVDEMLIAAWVDGALSREEREELAERLQDPTSAARFYRDAQEARHASEQYRRAADGSAERIRPGAASDGFGRLLMHESAAGVTVLDAAPTDRSQGPPVELLTDGSQRIRLPFRSAAVQAIVRPRDEGVQLTLGFDGAPDSLPAGSRWHLTDESNRTMFTQDATPHEAVPLPPLRPGVYQLSLPPSPIALVLCINGELGTTEIHRLLGL